jgi:hypothetical protein
LILNTVKRFKVKVEKKFFENSPHPHLNPPPSKGEEMRGINPNPQGGGNKRIANAI